MFNLILGLLLIAEVAQIYLYRRQIKGLQDRVTDAEEGLAELHSHLFDAEGKCEIKKLHDRTTNATRNGQNYREEQKKQYETLFAAALEAQRGGDDLLADRLSLVEKRLRVKSGK